MKLLIDYPELTEAYAPHFKDCFSEAGYIHFKKFISGLLVSPNKTIESINRLFVLDRRNQSSMNKFMNRNNFDLEELANRRISLMQQSGSTCFKTAKVKGSGSGVLSIDNSLLSHYGPAMDNISRLYDYVDKTYTLAHNFVGLHYSDDLTDYPIYNELWIPADWEKVLLEMDRLDIHINKKHRDRRSEQPKKWRTYMNDRFRDKWPKFPSLGSMYRNKSMIALDLLRRFQKACPDAELPVTMDYGYSGKEVCHILDTELNMSYVGALAGKQIVSVKGSSERLPLQDLAARLKAQQLEGGEKKIKKTSFRYKGEKKTRYSYSATHHIKGYGRRKLVIAFKREDLSDEPYFLFSNRTRWQASAILRIGRHRWPIEVFHQEGKAEGLDKYQLRNFSAINAHIAFVSIAYTLLKRALHDESLMSRLRGKLGKEFSGTPPGLRNAVQLGAIIQLTEFVYLHALKGGSLASLTKNLFEPLVY